MPDPTLVKRIQLKYRSLSGMMDERMRRQWAAAEAADLGWGGVTTVARATGLARNTVMAGTRELTHRREHPKEAITLRIRRLGAGRKPLTETDPELQEALNALVDPVTRGHPESPLLWTCKSTAKLAAELRREEHVVSERTVAALLKAAGYSLQANRKTREGLSHPDRNAQFEYINRRVLAFQRGAQPVVSVDTKKKELVGEFKNPGQEWEVRGEPTGVNVHDFPDPRLARPFPMASTTWPATKVGGAWGSTMIRRALRPRASAGGGRKWARRGSREPPG